MVRLLQRPYLTLPLPHARLCEPQARQTDVCSKGQGPRACPTPAQARKAHCPDQALEPVRPSGSPTRCGERADTLGETHRPGLGDSASESSAQEDDDEEEEDAHEAMRAALAAHQASFLSEALPMASTSALAQAPAKETKSVWEMDDADFEDGEEDSEEAEDDVEEELSEQEELVANQKQRASIPCRVLAPRETS